MLWFLLACSSPLSSPRAEHLTVALDADGRPTSVARDLDGDGAVDRTTWFTWTGPRLQEVAWQDAGSARQVRPVQWFADRVVFDGTTVRISGGRAESLLLAGGSYRRFVWDLDRLRSVVDTQQQRTYQWVDPQRLTWHTVGGGDAGLCTFDEHDRLVFREIDVSGVGQAQAVSRSEWAHGPHGWTQERTVTAERAWMVERTWTAEGVTEVETVGTAETLRRSWTVQGGTLTSAWMDWLLQGQYTPVREPVYCQGARRAPDTWVP